MAVALLLSALVTTATVSTATTAYEPAAKEDKDEEMAPDRPGFADSTRTVPPGHVEIEAGVRASFESEATDIQAPSMLVRVGLVRHLELRVTAPDVVLPLPSEGSDLNAGVNDMVFGVKLAGGVGESFEVSMIPFFSIPTGTEGQSSRGVDGGLELNFQVAPTDTWAIGWNVIAGYENHPDLDDERVFNFGAGVSLGYSFNNAFGAFIESYVQYEKGGKAQPSVAGGVTYLLTETFQLDLSGGTGLTDESEGPYVSAGVATLL